MEKQYVDFSQHLQGLLDALAPNLFKVTNERNLDGDMDGDVVVSALSGNINKNSATIPYQIDVFTYDPENTMNVFTKLAHTYNKTSFTNVQDEKLYTIFQYYNTPVDMDKDIEIGQNHLSRIVIFAQLYIMFQVSNVKKITIDNEEIETLNGTLAYVCETHSNRVSGVQMNKDKKKAATLQLTFAMISKDSVFGRKLFLISTGQLDGNTSFSVVVDKTNGQTATLTMMITGCTNSWGDNALPSDQVSMGLYDNRQ